MPVDTAVDLQPVLVYLPPPLREIMEQLPLSLARTLEEIRIRQGRPLAIKTDRGDCFLDRRGQAVDMPEGAYRVTAEDVWKTVQLISQSSLYAFEEEFRQGFLTIPGGHRVGLAGKAVLEAGVLKTLRDIGSLCFRIARAVPGAARNILPYLIDRQDGRPYHTLIVSPPRAGKTTVLRDLVRLLSSGVPELSLSGCSLGVVDERGEIAASYGGMPQHDLGPRVDVLDHCPKAVGMLMLLRSMSPQVIATDEIGSRQDVDAVWEMVYTGVSVLATVHACRFEELEQRPYLRDLVAERVFQRYVFLSRRRGPGTLEGIWDGQKIEIRTPGRVG
jgi:stage III sporulation protein AA